MPMDRIVLLPDTQLYTQGTAAGELATTQIYTCDWLAAHATERRYVGLAQVGDISADGTVASTWMVSHMFLDQIVAAMPTWIATGNHDGTHDGASSEFTAAYPLSARSYLTSLDGETSENAWGTVAISGETWLVISLEWGPRDSILTLAGAVLAANPTTPAIIVVHAYLASDGALFDWSGRHEMYNPHQSTFPDGHTPNDGGEIWRKLVELHSNVKLVLCGHDIGPRATLKQVRSDGSWCWAVLCGHADDRIEYAGTDARDSFLEIGVDVSNRQFDVLSMGVWTPRVNGRVLLPMDSTT